MRLIFLSFLSMFLGAVLSHATPVCPTTVNTNSDCGFLVTIGAGGSISTAAVPNARPYDGSDDALVGIINNSGATYSGSFVLSGSGNGGGIFGFDGDGICTYVRASYCSSAATGYEGPLVTFSNISRDVTTGTINVNGLGDGASTYFSLESSPASITGITSATPEPASLSLFGLATGVGYLIRRRRKHA